jgi:hypothetical protein
LLALQRFAQSFDVTTALGGSALIGSGREAQSAAMRLFGHLPREDSALLDDPESDAQRLVD